MRQVYFDSLWFLFRHMIHCNLMTQLLTTFAYVTIITFTLLEKKKKKKTLEAS
jgi:hypothetical protein